MSAADKPFTEARIELAATIDPDDVVRGLNGNDELVLTFICQMLAVSHSSELRENLRARLTDQWDDEEYI